MAADAAPAAVPDPHDTTGNARTSGAQPGLLASALAPVAPARTAAFTLDPATTNSAENATTGASSDAFHTTSDTPAPGTKTGTGRGGAAQNQSVVKAWLLAGAERWKKGAGSNIKRLEVAKARAMAQQVKETRQVKVNRTDAPAPKSSPAAASKTGSAPKSSPASKAAPAPVKKSLGSKSQGPAPKGPKNSGTHSPGPGRNASAGNGRSTAGSAPTGGGKTQAPAGATPKARTGEPKPSKADPSKPPAPDGRSAAGAGKAGPQGPAGPAGKPSTTGARSSDKDTAGAKGDAGSRKSGDQQSKPGPGGTVEKPSGKDRKDSTSTPGKDDAKPAAGPERKDDQPAAKDSTKPTGKPDDKPAPTADKPDTKPEETGGKPAEKTGKPLNLRESRETGYRDGTRAARTVAHVKAYRDGAKDGWNDTTEAAEREKQRLDQDRDNRKKQRQEQQVPATTSADYHHPQNEAGPQPIPVTGINATHLTLGDGAARTTMTRGEVRTLKKFERRLAEKTSLADKAAEQTKHLKAHADAQAAKALQLLELSRSVKGGAKLTTALAKAHEAARAQAGQAEEIYRRASRAAEACRALYANTQTRYGAMYQAVVDSPETTPAEMTFYLGDRNG
ncbi:hypothetical protein ACWGH4_00405 [Streptomyces sp. NPDC054847]